MITLTNTRERERMANELDNLMLRLDLMVDINFLCQFYHERCVVYVLY